MLAVSAPEGGQLIHGDVVFGGTADAMLVEQNTRHAIIHWDQFSIAEGASVRFQQPDAQSAVLNRVIGAGRSDLLGELSANGQVFLLNPNGVLIGADARIDVGGFLASTLEVPDSDFLAGGDLLFSGEATAAVQNLGRVEALGGDIWLIARQVENQGSLQAADGQVGLAGGGEVLLTTGGDQRLFVRPAGGAGAVLNAGDIHAAAAELKALGGNSYALAINNSGIVRATGTAERDGQIWLVAGSAQGPDSTHDNQGLLHHSGELHAENADGRGGFIETSGSRVALDGALRTGRGGRWLLDPEDLEIDAALAAQVVAQIDAGTDVSLSADRHIDIQASIEANGDGDLELLSDRLRGGVGTITFASGVVVSNSGSGQLRFYYNPTSFDAPTDFSALIDAGSMDRFRAYMWLHDIEAVQAIRDNFAGHYALSGDIDASPTVTWRDGAGFIPIGDIYAGFQGMLDGRGHVIDGLHISISTAMHLGLFGYIDVAGVVENLGLDNVFVEGFASIRVGALAGANAGTIRGVRIGAGSILGEEGVGGLVGVNDGGLIEDSHSHADVSYSGTGVAGVGTGFGGLVGASGFGTIRRSFATGNVHGEILIGGLIGLVEGGEIIASYATGDAVGTVLVGGLVGGAESATVIDQTYSTGAVIGSGLVGGLIGYAGENPAVVTNSYWDTSLSGQAGSDGGMGLSAEVLRSGQLPAGFSPDIWSATPGEAPSLRRTDAPNVLWQLEGHFVDGASGVMVWAMIDGEVVGTGVSQADGQFLLDISVERPDSGQIVLFAESGGRMNRIVTVDAGFDGSLAVESGWLWVTSDATRLSQLFADLQTLRAGLTDYADGLMYEFLGGSSLRLETQAALRLELTAGNFELDTGLYTAAHTVHLHSDGLVWQSATAIDPSVRQPSLEAAALLLTGMGDFELDNLFNRVSTLAADMGGRLLLSTDSTLEIGSVGDVDGIDAHEVDIRTDSHWNSAHDLRVTETIRVADGETLRLRSRAHLYLDADIDMPSANLWLNAGDFDLGLEGEIHALGAINVNRFQLGEAYRVGQATWIQAGETLPAFLAQDFRIIDGSNFLRVAGGDGSRGNPYQIFDLYGLQGVGSEDLLEAHWRLTTDLDAAPAALWHGGLGFEPIGIGGSFWMTGSFDGGGHAIRNLTMNRPDDHYVGLFGTLQGDVHNLRLLDVSIHGGWLSVGGLAATFTGGEISDIELTGKISIVGAGGGGLLGEAYSEDSAPWIHNVIVRAEVTGEADDDGYGGSIGGLIGFFEGGSLTDAVFEGRVRGVEDVGGLIGYSQFASVSGVSVNADVEGYVAGGLLGYQVYSSLDTADFSGRVHGSGEFVGGAIGINMLGSAHQIQVRQAWVQGDFLTGGLIGANVGSLSESSFEGEVRGMMMTGGLVGLNEAYAEISGSYSRALVMGSIAGGVAGMNLGEIADSYSSSLVGGEIAAGLLAGMNVGDSMFYEDMPAEGRIERAYSDGAILGGNGRLVGFGEGEVEASYWSHRTAGFGEGSDTWGRDGDFREAATYAGWDFEAGPWRILEGDSRAWLDWQFAGGDPVVIDGRLMDAAGLASGLGYGVSVHMAGGVEQAWTMRDGSYYLLLAAPESSSVIMGWVDERRVDGALPAQRANVISAWQTGQRRMALDLMQDTVHLPDVQLGSLGEVIDQWLAPQATAFADAVLYQVQAGGLLFDDGIDFRFNRGTDSASRDFSIDRSLNLQASGRLYAHVHGNLSLAEGVVVSSEAEGDAIQLRVRDAFTNAAGAGALSAEAGRWLIWADEAAGHEWDGLGYAFLQFGASRTGDDSVLGTGNGLLFGETPTLKVTISLSDHVRKTYDGTRAAPITDMLFDVTGTQVGDVLDMDYADVTALFADAHAGTGKAVTVTGWSLLGAQDASGAPIYGYVLDNLEVVLDDGVIDPRTLTITALDRDKIYGDAFVFGSELDVDFSVEGFVDDGAGITGLLLASEGAVATAGVNGGVAYAITASDATGHGLGNYAIVYEAGELSVEARAIEVTAGSGRSVYGETPLAPGLMADNLAAGDSVADLVGLGSDFAVVGTTAAGSYVIRVTGELENENYRLVDRHAGQWLVDRRLLVVRAEDASRLVGDEDPDWRVRYDGLVNGEAGDDVVRELRIVTDAASDSPPGEYRIAIEDGVADNYLLQFEDGILTVLLPEIEIDGHRWPVHTVGGLPAWNTYYVAVERGGRITLVPRRGSRSASGDAREARADAARTQASARAGWHGWTGWPGFDPERRFTWRGRGDAQWTEGMRHPGSFLMRSSFADALPAESM